MGLANVLQVIPVNYVSTSAGILAETTLIQLSAHCVLLVRVCHNAVTFLQLVNVRHVRRDSTVLDANLFALVAVVEGVT